MSLFLTECSPPSPVTFFVTELTVFLFFFMSHHSCLNSQIPRFAPLYSGTDAEPNLIPDDLATILESCAYVPSSAFNNADCNKNNFFLLHINIRSLPKNFDNLQQLIQYLDPKPHIILVTELWLPSDCKENFHLQDYLIPYMYSERHTEAHKHKQNTKTP